MSASIQPETVEAARLERTPVHIKTDETRLLSATDPMPFETLREDGASDFVLVCEHAGTAVPERLNGLGVAPEVFGRHVAVDIGALGVSQRLSERFDAPLIAQPYSRLVVDCNRPFHAQDAIPEVSDAIEIPANRELDDTARRARFAAIHDPFHHCIDRLLEQRRHRGQPTILVAIHSFTPQMSGGAPRPWQMGLLCNRDRRFTQHVLDAFRAANPDRLAEINQPYTVDDLGDYTIPYHGERRGLPHLLIEVRNDLIGDAEGQALWADLISDAMQTARNSMKDTTQ